MQFKAFVRKSAAAYFSRDGVLAGTVAFHETTMQKLLTKTLTQHIMLSVQHSASYEA